MQKGRQTWEQMQTARHEPDGHCEPTKVCNQPWVCNLQREDLQQLRGPEVLDHQLRPNWTPFSSIEPLFGQLNQETSNCQ